MCVGVLGLGLGWGVFFPFFFLCVCVCVVFYLFVFGFFCLVDMAIPLSRFKIQNQTEKVYYWQNIVRCTHTLVVLNKNELDVVKQHWFVLTFQALIKRFPDMYKLWIVHGHLNCVTQ